MDGPKGPPSDPKDQGGGSTCSSRLTAVFRALAVRERPIAKLAILAGMRPGEIFAPTWGRMATTHADIRQRVYRGLADTPKTHYSERQAALAGGLLAGLEAWRSLSAEGRSDTFVLASERGTPLGKDNVWRRNMLPRLAADGHRCNFQVMRRTPRSWPFESGRENGRGAARVFGDVSLNFYSQSPVEGRLVRVNELESLLIQ
jgi:integrase